MLLSGRFFVGIMGSSTSFLFSIRCKNLVFPAIELRPIVGYNQLGYSEPTHYVLPYELNNLFIFDGCEGFCFYPFIEIIDGS